MQRKLLDDDKEKIQSDIKRDTPEEKVKDLLNWIKSVRKIDAHKVSIVCTLSDFFLHAKLSDFVFHAKLSDFVLHTK